MLYANGRDFTLVQQKCSTFLSLHTEKDISMQKCSALLALASLSLTLNPCLLEAQSSASAATTTPIKHLVVIFDENISFDHYFGTYPNAANPPGEPTFNASPNTPT